MDLDSIENPGRHRTASVGWSDAADDKRAASFSPQQWRWIIFVLVTSGICILAAFVAARLSSTLGRADFFDDVHWTVAYVAAAILGWLGVRWADPPQRDARRWFAYGLTASALGQIVWDVQEALGSEIYYPAPSDLLFMCFGPCVAYGMVRAIRDRQRRALGWAFTLDVAMLVLVMLAITMAVYLPQTPSRGLAVATLVLYPSSMLLAPCFVAVIAPTVKFIPNWRSLGFPIALLANAALWLQWIYYSQRDALLGNTWLYLAFSFLSVLLGLCAITWRVDSAADPAWERRCEALLRMLPLIAVCGAAIAIGLAWWLPDVSHKVSIGIYLSAAVTLALAVARQSLLLLERDRLIAAEKHAREVERRFQTVFQTARDGLALLDSSYRFLEVNPACTQLFGWERARLLNVKITDLPWRDRACFEHYLGVVEAQGMGLIETTFGQEGRLLHIELCIEQLPGSRGERFLIFRDLSERKKAEEARAQLEAQLRQSQKLEAIGTLASGIAHDFNNILSAILGNVELASHDTDKVNPAHTSLGEIRKAGHRAKELIRRIVAFARPQDANVKLQSPASVVSEAIQLVRVTLPASVNVTCNLDSRAPPVMVDSSQISQVLFNLCTNAYQAMPKGVGHIEISLDVRDIDEEVPRHRTHLPPGRYVCLHVRDTGRGMDPQTLQRIFEPFFTTKPNGEGSGLGLSIVHGIVRAHGGAVTVDSEPGHGTTFHIYLPAAPEGAAPEAEIATVPSAEGSGSNQHILYVDDEEALVFLTQRLLERRGYRVSGFTDAAAALSAFEADPSCFDLVITDKSMPGRSGTDLAQQMLLARPTTRIVLVSGYLRPEEIDQAKAIGIQEVILKPDTVDELAATVHRLLSQADEPTAVDAE